jgi:hypothetical protein
VSKPHPKAVSESITFRCANGHRIDVPATLAGKRGACSKCGIAVVIPALKSAGSVPAGGAGAQAPDAKPDPFADLFDSSDEPAATGTLAAEQNQVFAAQESAAEQSGVGGVLANPDQKTYADLAEVDGSENPTAQLVARLWDERDHGGVVELHIAGGSVILPEWYEANWSRGTHGLFASQAADGTVTLTAVAWDSIQKIVVRQVEGLPDGMFE